MLGRVVKLAMDPGAATSGVLRRLGLAVALVGLGFCVLFTALAFAGVGVYQLAALWLVPPWPALLTAAVALVGGVALVRSAGADDGGDDGDGADDGLSPADLAAPVARVVREHPWESVVAALAAGLVVGQSRDLVGLVATQLVEMGKAAGRTDPN